MFESIINTIFSIPYFLIGVLIAIMLDLYIHKFKASTRLTLLEIWRCVMIWAALIIIVVFYINKNN